MTHSWRVVSLLAFRVGGTEIHGHPQCPGLPPDVSICRAVPPGSCHCRSSVKRLGRGSGGFRVTPTPTHGKRVVQMQAEEARISCGLDVSAGDRNKGTRYSIGGRQELCALRSTPGEHRRQRSGPRKPAPRTPGLVCERRPQHRARVHRPGKRPQGRAQATAVCRAIRRRPPPEIRLRVVLGA